MRYTPEESRPVEAKHAFAELQEEGFQPTLVRIVGGQVRYYRVVADILLGILVRGQTTDL